MLGIGGTVVGGIKWNWWNYGGFREVCRWNGAETGRKFLVGDTAVFEGGEKILEGFAFVEDVAFDRGEFGGDGFGS